MSIANTFLTHLNDHCTALRCKRCHFSGTKLQLSLHYRRHALCDSLANGLETMASRLRSYEGLLELALVTEDAEETFHDMQDNIYNVANACHVVHIIDFLRRFIQTERQSSHNFDAHVINAVAAALDDDEDEEVAAIQLNELSGDVEGNTN